VGTGTFGTQSISRFTPHITRVFTGLLAEQTNGTKRWTRGIIQRHESWIFRKTTRRGNLLRTKTLKTEDLGQPTPHRRISRVVRQRRLAKARVTRNSVILSTAGGRSGSPSLSSYAYRGRGIYLPTMLKGPTPITSAPMAPVYIQDIYGNKVNKRKLPRGKRNLRCAERWCTARESIATASASD